ncbi:MAG: VOC family protein [Thermoanaerobaculia bacterium]
MADTEASLAFYRDFLGLRVAGASENWGPEQEHLNQVFGARLRITGLKGESGPGIELLEYLTPATGRPGPFDLAANDLLHWQTTLSGVDLDAAWKGFPRSGRRVSPGPVALGSTDLGFSRGLLVRDPDGHGLALMAP